MRKNKVKDKIKNGNYLTKYFTQFPNIIDDSNLTPFEFRVLLHYYRVGECWEGVRTTASKCNMSTGKVTSVRKSLIEKGFIKSEPNGDGVTIEVVDKTKDNMDKYRSCGEQGVHVVNDGVHVVNTDRSCGEHKNNPSKNTKVRTIGASAIETDIILEKKKTFQETIKPFVQEFGRDTCNAFYTYWSEVSRNGKKLKWEMEDTWETRLRLVRWKKNEDSRKPNKNEETAPVFRKEGTDNQHILDAIHGPIK